MLVYQDEIGIIQGVIQERGAKLTNNNHGSDRSFVVDNRDETAKAVRRDEQQQ